MEFCPEVAVLQSAFQLVQTMAGRKLETLSKTECADYVHILQTTLEEICHGLESDLELQDQLLWQKNLHTLILYALVQKVYKAREQGEGIPVLSPLDVLVQSLPKFSCHLYFELVKACAWEHLLINSLPYLELSVSQQLLEDLIQDSTQDPITCSDVKVMNSLRDALMSSLLSVPFEYDSVMEKQLKPLSKPDKCIPLSKENLDDYDTDDVKETLNASKIAGEGTTEIQAVNHDDQLSVSQDQKKDNLETEDVQNDDSGVDQSGNTSHTEQSTRTLDGADKISMPADGQKADYKLFWSNFLNKNSSFLPELLESIESQLEKNETSFGYFQCLAQLGLIGFIKTEITKAGFWAKWFVFNMFPESDELQANSSAETVLELRPVYIMSNLIADQMDSQINIDRWLYCVHKVLQKGNGIFQGVRENLQSCLPKSRESQNDRPAEPQNSEVGSVFSDNDCDRTKDFLHIVSGLCVQKDVFHRMMQGCLDEMENTVTNDTSKLISECKDMMVTMLKNGGLKGTNKTVGDTKIVTADGEGELGFKPEMTVMGVKYGELWQSDLTLAALCWRIKYRLPFCQDCVEMLLEPSCNKFWLDESVYDTFSRDIQLLAEKDRVIRLSEILRTLEGKSREVTQKAQQLTCRTFTALSFMDQDTVAMEMYVRDETLRDFLDFEDVQMMTVFNRITALRDDQILSELLLLCLCDPRDVLSTAVKMSVSNKDQAKNFAQVLQFFPSICQTSHPTHHPDCSLLVDVIGEFLHTTSLTDKEQTTFLVFLTTLWQVPLEKSKKPLFSPMELMYQVITPFIGVHCLLSDGPITCKFALTMLKTMLQECGCNILCDWSEFEPMALVLCLSELLQECVTFWDTDEFTNGIAKITVKHLVQGCLKQLSKMFHEENLTTTETAIEWFTSCLSNFDISVVLQLHVILASLGSEQCIQNYQETVKILASNEDSSVTSTLLIAGVQPEMIQHATVQQTAKPIDYDEILVSLIQVLPNLLSSEFESTVKYVMWLIDQNSLAVPYRVGYISQIPLTSIKEFQSVVGVSQILRDVIITLGFLSDKNEMLGHVLQCYTACVKSLNSTTNVYGTDVKLFIISQIFHHVCDIVQLLPQQTEPVLVLLLHLLTSYTDIHKNSDSVLNRQKWKKRMVDAITKDIQLSVDALPESLVEKEMLIKKIRKVA